MSEQESERVGMFEGMKAQCREERFTFLWDRITCLCSSNKCIYLLHISLPVLHFFITSQFLCQICSFFPLMFSFLTPVLCSHIKAGYINILCVLQLDRFGNIKSLVEDQLQTSMVSKLSFNTVTLNHSLCRIVQMFLF